MICKTVLDLLSHCCARWRDLIPEALEIQVADCINELQKKSPRNVKVTKTRLEALAEDIKEREVELGLKVAVGIEEFYASFLIELRKLQFVSQEMRGLSLDALKERTISALRLVKNLEYPIPQSFHYWHELAIYVGAAGKEGADVLETGFPDRVDELVWVLPDIRDVRLHVIGLASGGNFDFMRFNRRLVDRVILHLERLNISVDEQQVPASKKQKAIEMKNNGATWQEVQTECGISRSTLERYAKSEEAKHGTPLLVKGKPGRPRNVRSGEKTKKN